MKYRIAHSTNYRYPAPVSVCHNTLMLSPQSSGRLQVESHRLVIRPTPISVKKRRDMFGNAVNRFSLEENHSQLTIVANSRVTVISKPVDESAESPTCDRLIESLSSCADTNWLATAPFCFDSPRITRGRNFIDYAATSLVGDKPVLQAARDLTSQIHREFSYDTNATKVDTLPDAALAGKHGVCQDFAHVAIACLRSYRIPARYVSGYLRTLPPPGKPRMVGADESHAWIAAYCGESLGWVELDPTNDCICGPDHIPIAYGRDYTDVVPVKGVFLGGGEPQLSVSVDVAPEEDSSR